MLLGDWAGWWPPASHSHLCHPQQPPLCPTWRAKLGVRKQDRVGVLGQVPTSSGETQDPALLPQVFLLFTLNGHSAEKNHTRSKPRNMVSPAPRAPEGWAGSRARTQPYSALRARLLLAKTQRGEHLTSRTQHSQCQYWHYLLGWVYKQDKETSRLQQGTADTLRHNLSPVHPIETEPARLRPPELQLRGRRISV